MPCEASFHYRERDVIAAQRAQFMASWQGKFLVPILTILLGAIPMVASSLPGAAAPQEAPWIVGLKLAAIPLVVCVFIFFVFNRFNFRSHSTWRPRYHVRIEPEALFMSTDGAAEWASMPWNTVTRRLEIPEAFVLTYTSAKDFVILPKEPLDEAAQDAIRQYLAQTDS